MGVKYLSFAVRIILLQQICCSCFASAGFVESPSSETIEIENGVERFAVFRCRHQNIVAVISWQINGTSSRLYHDVVDGFIRDDSDARVDTLTIPAVPKYSGAYVVCVATLDTSREETPQANLTVIATEGPSPSRLPSTTETPPSTGQGANFEVVPSPLTVAVEQETATFVCQHTLCDTIGWEVDGLPLNRAGLPNITATLQQSADGVNAYILSIGTLLEYNQISIACVAFFSGLSQSTTPVTLFIQDTPGQVENATCQRDYYSDMLTTFWDPLPTLDINNTDPDIIYTVELFDITCGQNVFISNKIVAGSNSSEGTLDLMQIYKAVVVPKNNVRKARNGPSVEMEETFMSLNGPTLLGLARYSQINIESLDPVPSFYVMILESLDGLDNNNMVVNITVHRNKEMVSIAIERVLPFRSLWTASILAYGCESHATVTELSTHDIQNVTISSPLHGQIRVTGDFLEESTATGVFLVLYSLASEDDVLYIAKEKEQESIFDARVNGLSATRYGVAVFLLENQVPFPRVVVSPKIVGVANNNQEMTQQLSIEYKLRATSTGVCITCTFLDSSTSDCVAVVHQRISQLSSSGLMNIESSHKFNRSGDTAYGCIEGVSQKLFKIGVAGGRMIMETNTTKKESSPAGAVAAGVALGVLFFAVIVGMIVIVIPLYARKRRPKTVHVAVEPRYSVVEIIHRPVQSEDVESGSPNLKPTTPQETMEESAEVEPLLLSRVVADGTSTPPESESAAHHSLEDHKDTSGAPPVLGSADNGGSSDPTYAQPVLLRSLKNTVHPPATTEKTVYDDIGGFQNQQGQHYALPQVESSSKGGAVIDDLHQVVYIEVKPHSLPEKSEDQNIDCTSDRAVTPLEPAAAVREPLTTERLFSFLLPHASKWRKLGIALSLDEDRLDDEVFPNNETDEACLQEMIELYMLRSDLDHSWEKIQTVLKNIESSDVSASVQEENPSQYSPRFTGKIIMHVSSTAAAAADIHHDEEVHAAIEEDVINDVDQQCIDRGHNISDQFSNDKQPAACKQDSDHEEQGGNSDSGYSGSQQSESESSDNGVMIESEGDSTKLSEASLEEQSEVREKNRPTLNLSISLSENLDDYESGGVPSHGSEATVTGDVSDDGEFGRPTEEKIPSSPTASPCSSDDQSCLQVDGFCEKPEDRTNDEGLCKITSVQDSHAHNNYKEAMMHQLGLHAGQKIRDKLGYNNAVEELSLVHSGIEHLDQRLQHSSIQTQFNQPVKFYMPTSSAALDITKIHVHDLVSTSSVSSKYSPSLIRVTVHLENNCFVILLFSCLILHVVFTYSCKSHAVDNVCSMNVCVYLMYHIY